MNRLGFIARSWRLIRSISDRNEPTKARILAFLTLAYLVSPLDPIPDLIPVLGWLDDLGVLTVAAFVADKWLSDPSRKKVLQQIRPA
jgi:uncharacterized membrane protein YkvA (DUF1232 family)